MIGFKDSIAKLDAIRDMWAETGLDTDAIDVEMIVEWFDKRRGIKEEDIKEMSRELAIALSWALDTLDEKTNKLCCESGRTALTNYSEMLKKYKIRFDVKESE